LRPAKRNNRRAAACGNALVALPWQNPCSGICSPLASYNVAPKLQHQELKTPMIGSTRTFWRARLLFAGLAGAAVLTALISASPPAQARVWVSVAAPCCGYAYPGPYYGYPPPPPYAYAPPPGYYPPPDAGIPGAGAPGAYPPAGPAPSAYTPDAPAPSYPPATGYAPTASYAPTAGYAPTASYAPTANGAAAQVTYTNKPAFTNAAGQTCRQYKTTDTSGGHPVDVYGTACRQADGQWRVVD
jgi:hypothetical protein